MGGRSYCLCAGLIGQMIVCFCQYAGARYIFSVDISDKRLSFLPSEKRIISVNPKPGFKKLVSDKTAGRMADIVMKQPATMINSGRI